MNEDHVNLYRTIGGLRRGDVAALGERIKALLRESKAHFAREEALMDIYGYDLGRAHRYEHLALIRSLEMYQSRLSAAPGAANEDVSRYLKQWLTKHIRTADRMLERFLLTADRNRELHCRMAVTAASRVKLGVLLVSSRNRSADARELFAGQPIDDSPTAKAGLHLDEVMGVGLNSADDCGIAPQGVIMHGRQQGFGIPGGDDGQ